MNYHHDYHAGAFSDVLKHIVLIALLQALHRKNTPFCYLDIQAGNGYYDLGSENAQKTNEAALGIHKIMKALNSELFHEDKDKIPNLVKIYAELVQKEQYPSFYPGSPLIAQSFMRANDRMILIEYQDNEVDILRTVFKKNTQVAIHQQDGYLGLKAFLPPKEGRGLILIDPAFEDKEEWNKILEGIKNSQAKFPHGIYAIWYPLKDLRAVDHFLNKVKALKLSSVLNIELSIYPSEGSLNLPGSGMLIINPPWKIQEEIEKLMPWLWKTLSVNRSGGYSIQSFS